MFGKTVPCSAGLAGNTDPGAVGCKVDELPPMVWDAILPGGRVARRMARAASIFPKAPGKAEAAAYTFPLAEGIRAVSGRDILTETAPL